MKTTIAKRIQKTIPQIRHLALGLLLGICLTAEAAPMQTNQGALNLRVSHVQGPVQTVNLTYDLVSSNTAPMYVTVEVSTNGGLTYDLPVFNISGDVGLVNLGSSKTAVWNLAQDWPNQSSTNVWFRLIATDTDASVVPAGMVVIPGGTFRMGDKQNLDANAVPVHPVNVSAFYIEKFEVAYALWEEVRDWGVMNEYSFESWGGSVASNHPGYYVSWYDAVKWCNARSQREGLTPAYYTDATHTTIYRTGQIDLTNGCVNWTANGYRLPTEAEWEKAARGGLTYHHFPWPSYGGGYADHVDGSKANYSVSGDPFESNPDDIETSPVGYYDGQQTPAGGDMANGYGLYDMAGNVLEWCWDWYDNTWYTDAAAIEIDTRGPAVNVSSLRVLRGGSWAQDPWHMRCAYRYWNQASFSAANYGFRCVRGL